MIIQSWQVSRFQVPLRFTFSQANQHTQHSDSLILRLQTKGGIEAFGEACPRTYVTGESPESVQVDLQKVEPLLIGLQINSFADLQSVVFQLLAPKIGLASLCLLEIALLDAWGKSQGHPLAKDLGVSQEGILHYSGIVPLTKPAHLQKLLPVLKSFAFAELKIKVGNSLSDAIETIAIIKEHWGDSMPIRVDANTSWTVAQAYEMIPALIKAGVRVIEQPLLPRLDQEMPALCWEFGGEVKLMADESLTTLGSAERLVESGAFNHYNLKVSKNGGILSTIRLYRYLQMQGMSAQLGAHFGETSILTAAGMWVAVSAPGLRAIEGGLGSWLLEKDIGSESLRIDRNAQIKLDTLASPGLGWSVRPKAFLTKKS